MITIVSRTDLARRTRQALELARRQGVVLVESYGEEQVAILDALDYRLLRALARYHHSASVGESHLPKGLSQEEVQEAVAEASGDVQAAWNLVIGAYMAGEVSLGRAAELLNLSRFELLERLNRLSMPLYLGPQSTEEAKAELERLRV